MENCGDVVFYYFQQADNSGCYTLENGKNPVNKWGGMPPQQQKEKSLVTEYMESISP